MANLLTRVWTALLSRLPALPLAYGDRAEEKAEAELRRVAAAVSAAVPDAVCVSGRSPRPRLTVLAPDAATARRASSALLAALPKGRQRFATRVIVARDDADLWVDWERQPTAADIAELQAFAREHGLLAEEEG